jgi:uncharacterized protein
VSWPGHGGNPNAQLITTEEVFAEVLTWFGGKGAFARQAAARAVRTFSANLNVRVLPQTTAGFHDALSLYESRLDKSYSLVDCRSMLAMRELGLTEVLSNDHHFEQEGFAVLFS